MTHYFIELHPPILRPNLRLRIAVGGIAMGIGVIDPGNLEAGFLKHFGHADLAHVAAFHLQRDKHKDFILGFVQLETLDGFSGQRLTL